MHFRKIHLNMIIQFLSRNQAKEYYFRYLLFIINFIIELFYSNMSLFFQIQKRIRALSPISHCKRDFFNAVYKLQF